MSSAKYSVRGELLIMKAEQLMAEARQAREQAYVPYSCFAVGAALLTEDGKVFHGCNIENASYSPTNCAERTAFFKAVSEGYREFAALAVIADTESGVAPCGVCRQVMVEFCAGDMPVYLGNLRGDLVHTSVAALLPGAFTPRDLHKDR